MSNQRKYYQKNNLPSLVKFENREIWADLENRSKVVHSEICMAAGIGQSGPCDSPCDRQSRDPLRPMKICESLVARCQQSLSAAQTYVTIQNFGPQPQRLWWIKISVSSSTWSLLFPLWQPLHGSLRLLNSFSLVAINRTVSRVWDMASN